MWANSEGKNLLFFKILRKLASHKDDSHRAVQKALTSKPRQDHAEVSDWRSCLNVERLLDEVVVGYSDIDNLYRQVGELSLCNNDIEDAT